MERFNVAVRSVALGQNFLRNQKTARRLAYLAGTDPDLTCYDLGAGKGMITEGCLVRSGRVVAVELDPRLAEDLRQRFASEPRVSVIEADVLSVPLPTEPFVVAANPAFNLSTALCRRWLLAETFVSGAIIFEKPFAARLAGMYGATKHSMAFAPFVDLTIERDVRPAEFSPQPRVPTAILLAHRRQNPGIPWEERTEYWRVVNYLFERSHPVVGDALRPLQLTELAASLLSTRVRDLDCGDAVELYTSVRALGQRGAAKLASFEATLTQTRRLELTTDSSSPRWATKPRPSGRAGAPPGQSRPTLTKGNGRKSQPGRRGRFERGGS